MIKERRRRHSFHFFGYLLYFGILMVGGSFPVISKLDVFVDVHVRLHVPLSLHGYCFIKVFDLY